MSEVQIEKYDGPAAARTSATHRITVGPEPVADVPGMEFMGVGTCYQEDGGDCYEIVAAIRDRRKKVGQSLLNGRDRETYHVYLAKQIWL
jgi:hypothetical protein